VADGQVFEVVLDEHDVCVVRGELDEATGAELERLLSERPDVASVDLGEVSFVDSAGLRALLVARQRLQAAGRDLVVRRSSGAVRRVMRLAGVSHLFVPAGEQGQATAG
jgi:anti-anti-sigma factor